MSENDVSSHLKHRNGCRLCGSKAVRLAFSLAPTPPANAFVKATERDQPQECYPLDVFFCDVCTHVQLLDVVDPRDLFGTYLYVSGTSPSFARHFEDYARSVAAITGSLHDSLVVDIGSNDGTLLRAFKDAHGSRVLGIDPAANLAAAARVAGIPTITEFFTPASAARILAESGPAKAITANNVFAHIDDLGAVADGVRVLLAPDGIFVFEVSYLLDVIGKVLFDTIYHEHLCYHAVRPLEPFLRAHGLDLIDAIRVPSHGGSLRGVAQRHGGPKSRSTRIDELLRLEEKQGLHRYSTYVGFAERINAVGTQLRKILQTIKQDGKHVAGYGAPAKATTLMYQFGLDAETLDYIVDDSPLKQGTFTPGLHVPVVSSDAITAACPDYLLILAWNFADSIIENNREFIGKGGHFVVPLPETKVI